MEFFPILRSENFAIRNAELLIFAPKFKINSFSFMRSYIKIIAYFLKASKTPDAYSIRLSFLTIWTWDMVEVTFVQYKAKFYISMI